MSGYLHQLSLFAGTIFCLTKLDLTVWFEAVYLVTLSKAELASLEMARRLGVMQKMAWELQQKLSRVMLERESDKPIDGLDKRAEIDDACTGGERHGRKRGRGAVGKNLFVAAVKCNQEGHRHQ